MALISCYECGKEISSLAASCPHCGAPALKYEKREDGLYGLDGSGKAIYAKSLRGGDFWFDDKGKIDHFRHKGIDSWMDDKGKISHAIFPNGIEIWYEYNDNGNKVHEKRSDGKETWYDENGNETHIKWPDGNETWYDKDGNEIHAKSPDGKETWYDENGNETHIKWPDGDETWYDKDGKKTHIKWSDWNETWYDKDGNRIGK